MNYCNDMVQRIYPRRRGHLYLKEWMDHRNLNDEQLACRLGRARETINRWRNYPARLDPDKLVEIAYALDCEPADLFRHPSYPDLNAVVDGAPEEIRAAVLDVARRLVGRR